MRAIKRVFPAVFAMSVAWCAERKTVLCACFGFLTLWVWLRYAGRCWRVPARGAGPAGGCALDSVMFDDLQG